MGDQWRNGWYQGIYAYDPYGYGYGYPGVWAEAEGPFAAPEGYGWYEINMGLPNPYDPFAAWAQQGGELGHGGYPQGFGIGGFNGVYAGGFGYNGVGFPYNGWGGYGSPPDNNPGEPLNDGGRPAINLRNEFGGIGLPPGTNYHFPSEHCIVMELKVREPPWRNNHRGPLPMQRHMVPVNTNVKSFMKNMGCTNADESKNVMYELVTAGDGLWYKGIVVKMDDRDKMKKTLGDFMWTKSRNGVDDVPVYLYFTKD